MKELNLDNIRILIHSAIRIEGSDVVYFDPFHLKEEPHDADFIFITHDHFDHFSAEDVKKVALEKTILCAPLSCKESIERSEVLPKENLVWLKPGDSAVFGDIKALSVAAYNIGKKFHPKENGWLGYVVTMDGVSYYVAGSFNGWTGKDENYIMTLADEQIEGKDAYVCVSGIGKVLAVVPVIENHVACLWDIGVLLLPASEPLVKLNH